MVACSNTRLIPSGRLLCRFVAMVHRIVAKIGMSPCELKHSLSQLSAVQTLFAVGTDALV
jgi:hypothetical protein